jgi:hypothetical protein
MMRTIKILLFVLVVQVALGIWLNLDNGGLETFSSEEKIIDIDAGQIDQIVIEEKEQDPVKLVLKEGNWIVPESDNFPVSPLKLKKITEDLLGTVKSWPVGKTKAAAKQLKVSEVEYNKKITLFKGGKVLKTLFLGTSPGFRKVHLKLGGSAPIYSIGFNSYEISSKAKDWFDEKLLNFDRGRLMGLQLGDITLEKKAAGFEVLGLDEGEKSNVKEVSALISKVITLAFDEVLGTEEKSDYAESTVLEFSVQLKDQDPIVVKVTKPKEKDDYYVLKSSGFPYFFKVRKSVFDAIKETTRSQLVEKKEEKSDSKKVQDPKTDAVEIEEEVLPAPVKAKQAEVKAETDAAAAQKEPAPAAKEASAEKE